jgi:hypothetical protein
VALRGRTQYTFIPVCDGDCAEVDLRVLDPAGRELVRASDDDIPMATLMTGSSGMYRVRLVMSSCSQDPCAFAVGMYSR